jgi:hypothetical protein
MIECSCFSDCCESVLNCLGLRADAFVCLVCGCVSPCVWVQLEVFLRVVEVYAGAH